ncbi:DUF1761 domain-containing protein [Afifella sp. JA880]|uniref:DUF1761 domain-containing protein n=1 Tax=Afifella sp. JA880 TaxID=2975280 RepID=UPI0021BA5054|nr:DUF1761 domain-containing protein [Afifella sp. JA880]MCT8268596.1 DUF1761 domain-containing protein [Afifella sp. JA880]
MQFGSMNYWAIPLAGVFGFHAHLLWLRILPAPKDVSDDVRRSLAVGAHAVMRQILVFILILVMAYVLAGAIGHLGPGQATTRNGVISAAILWAGFVATTSGVNGILAGQPARQVFMTIGRWFFVLVVESFCLGVLGA